MLPAEADAVETLLWRPSRIHIWHSIYSIHSTLMIVETGLKAQKSTGKRFGSPIALSTCTAIRTLTLCPKRSRFPTKRLRVKSTG